MQHNKKNNMNYENIDEENIKYLEDILHRVLDYDYTRASVIEYVLDNKIRDANLATNLFVMGFLWQASRRNEILSEVDLIMLLDVENDADTPVESAFTNMVLDEDQAKLELEDLLASTVKNYK